LNRWYKIQSALCCLVVFSVLAGCGYLEKSHGESPKIDTSNGVSTSEAFLIAQGLLEEADEKRDYHIKKPQVLTDILVRDYPDYWFIIFPAKKFEKSFWSYLVVINRRAGQVAFSGAYVELDVVDYSWVFE